VKALRLEENTLTLEFAKVRLVVDRDRDTSPTVILNGAEVTSALARKHDEAFWGRSVRDIFLCSHMVLKNTSISGVSARIQRIRWRLFTSDRSRVTRCCIG